MHGFIKLSKPSVLEHRKSTIFECLVQNLNLPFSFSISLGSFTDHFMATGSFSNFKISFNLFPSLL